MKNKKNLLSVLLAAVLLCACVAGMLVFGVSAGEEATDPNTTVYLIREEDGNDDGSVDEDGILVFKTIRGATAYADTQTWDENAKLRIEIDQDSISMMKTSNYLFVTSNVNIIFREDSSCLPIIITGRGETKAKIIVNKAKSDDKVGTLIFCNDLTFENIEFNTTTDATIYVSNRTEFKDCTVKLEGSGAIAGSGYTVATYHFTNEAALEKRLDDNGEITSTAIFSGNTNVTATYVYGTINYSGEPKTGTDTDLGKYATVGTEKVYYSDINGHVIFKDNAVFRGTVRSIRNSTFLGDGKVTLSDNAKITGAVQGSFNRNVKGNAAIIFEMTGGTVEGKIVAMAQTGIGVYEGSRMQFAISGGTVKGAVTYTKTASTAGEFGFEISGGTFEKAVSGDNVSLADGANVSIKEKGSLDVDQVGANVTVNKLDDWADFATVYVKAPQNAAITVVDNSESDACILNDENGYEVRGWYLAPSVSMILNQRVQLKALINKELCQLYTANFGTPAFSFKLGEKDLGVSAADLAEEGENYVALLPAAGAGDFDLALDYIFGGKVAISTNIQTVAEKGVTLYAGTADEAIFKALVDYGSAANGATELKYFDAAKLEAATLPEAAAPVAGAGNVKISAVTLLMGDAIGIRFKSESDLTGITVKVNGERIGSGFYSTKEGAIDLYINAENLNEILNVEVLDANGTLCATFGYAVSNIAADIYQKDNTNLKAAAVLELILAIESAKTVA